MKTKVSLALISLLLISLPVFAQDELPERGSIADIKGLTNFYVATDDDDAYKAIARTLKNYKAVEVVSTAKDAEFFLEYKVLTRDVAPGRGGADLAKRSQLRAIVKRGDSRVISWTETETFDMDNGFSISRPNEINLTLNFIKAHKKAFAEKKKK